MTCKVPIRFVVVTTVNLPTEALRRWSSLDNCQLVAVGDAKTPVDWHMANVVYVPLTQESRLAKILPWNHYARKMLGYERAFKAGAEVIVDSDDDNLPFCNWSFPDFEGSYELISAEEEFVNVYACFSDKPIWPRGYPLDKIMVSKLCRGQLRHVRVGIWQGLIDGDSDVDAIYRLTRGDLIAFEKRPPIVLDVGHFCPFNSQNTVFHKDVFALLYLPSTVSFRFTDILRGLVAQPILWKAGYHLGFTEATVSQERNRHDYMMDFRLEIPMYLHAEEAAHVVKSAVKFGSIIENLSAAYCALASTKLVSSKELFVLDAWIDLFR